LGTFTEWRDFRRFVRRKPQHRQEAAYEFEDTALAAKSEQELSSDRIYKIFTDFLAFFLDPSSPHEIGEAGIS